MLFSGTDEKKKKRKREEKQRMKSNLLSYLDSLYA